MRLRPDKSEANKQKETLELKMSNLVFQKQIKQIHKFLFSFSENLSFHFSAFPKLASPNPLHPVYNDNYRSASYLQSFVLSNLHTNEFETITRNQNIAQEIIKEKKVELTSSFPEASIHLEEQRHHLLKLITTFLNLKYTI